MPSAPTSGRPVALVTGGNRGIGRAIVLALAEREFDIAFIDVVENGDTEATLREAQARGARIAFAQADIARLDEHDRIADAAYALGGRLDVLVNNAGVSVAVRGDVLDVTAEAFDRVMGINLRGTFFLTQTAARRMLQDPPGRHPRSIITVSSANAFLVSDDRAEYCLAKTALSMMVKVYAARLGRSGIAAYEIRPGIIRTDMTRVAAKKYDALIAGGLTPIDRWGEPDDVGNVVVALASGEMPFMTGDAFHVDGGLHIHRL